MTDLLPVIVQDLGAGNGRARRVTSAELESYFQTLAQFMPSNSVLVRSASGTPQALVLGQGQILGRGRGGSLTALDSAGVDELIDLNARLGELALRIHQHSFQQGISDIRWDTLQNDRVLARVGGEFRWIPTPTGGGGGSSDITNPLGAALDLGGNDIVDGSNSVIKFENGRPVIGGYPIGGPAAPNVGEVLRWVAGEGFTPGKLGIGVLTGTTQGRLLAVGAGGTIIEVDPPSTGGGGLSNPLTTDLDLGGHALMSGATELISVQSGEIYVGGKLLLPVNIDVETVADKESVHYDSVENAFVNRRTKVGDIEGETAGKFIRVGTGGSLEEVDAPSGGGITTNLGTLAEKEALLYNETENAFVNRRMVPADMTGETQGKFLAVGAGGDIVEVDAPSGGGADPGTPGTAEFANGPNAGPAFPTDPVNHQAFYRSDLMRTFVYRDDLAVKATPTDPNKTVWIAIDDRVIEIDEDTYDATGTHDYAGNGYGRGIYFATSAIVMRNQFATGGCSLQLRYMVNTNNAGITFARDWTIAFGFYAVDEPLLFIPENSMLTLRGQSYGGSDAGDPAFMKLQIRDCIEVV